MAGNILPTLLKMKSDGNHVFSMPATLQNLARYFSADGVTPSTVFHDTRSDKRRQADEKGLPPASLNESLTPYQIRPTIQMCEVMGYPTDPVIWHAEHLHLIVMVYRDPKNQKKTLIKMFNDNGPFDLKDQAVVEYPTAYATHSYDRRSQIEQTNDKQLIIGLTYVSFRENMIVKVKLDDKLKCKGEVIESEELADNLWRVHSVSSNLVLAFHRQRLILRDANLEEVSRFGWVDQVGFPVKQLWKHGISLSYSGTEQASTILVFEIYPQDSYKIPTKSVYDKCLAKVDTHKGKSFIALRMKLRDDGLGMEVNNQDKQSIIFKDEIPRNVLEYAQDKLFVLGEPTHMYLVEDWQSVRVIFDPKPANTLKYQAMLLPGFDEQTFPFIAFTGQENLSVFNVKTCTHQPLLNHQFSVEPGNQSLFFAMDGSGMQVHYAGLMLDKEGTGKQLIHHSHIDLKADALHWLRENGRLPATTTAAYFEEIKELNRLNRITETLEIKSNENRVAAKQFSNQLQVQTTTLVEAEGMLDHHQKHASSIAQDFSAQPESEQAQKSMSYEDHNKKISELTEMIKQQKLQLEIESKRNDEMQQQLTEKDYQLNQSKIREYRNMIQIQNVIKSPK